MPLLHPDLPYAGERFYHDGVLGALPHSIVGHATRRPSVRPVQPRRRSTTLTPSLGRRVNVGSGATGWSGTNSGVYRRATVARTSVASSSWHARSTSGC